MTKKKNSFLTFKSALAGLLAAVLSVLLLHVTRQTGLVWLCLPVGLFLLSLVYGSSCIESNFFTRVICAGETEEKCIALTFDDGPHPVYTPQVLALLTRYDVKATFFVIGKNLAGQEALVRQIHADGHLVGSHSYTHSPWIDLKNTAGFKRELEQTAQELEAIIGIRPKLFRPPFGVITPHLAKAANTLDYSIVGWSIRSFDTVPGAVESATDRVTAQLKPGGVILLHDTSAKSVAMLERILDFARHNDYNVVSLERLLNIEAYRSI
jgi:peptidoglycan-N-acetylglucosamine deacetylase